MSATIFAAVIGAALLHALWNALVKGGRDKLLGMTAVVVGQGLFGALALLVFPLPSAESLPYIAAAIVLHVGYQAFLVLAYRAGDLTQVYPIARGTAPLIVAGVSAVFLEVRLAPAEWAGVLVIACGIISLALVRRADGLRNGKAGLLAVATGCFIAAYSLVDGMGARVSGSAVGFFGVAALGNAIAFSAVIAAWRPSVLRALPGAARVVLAGGGASFTAYALVVHAFTQAPIALVTALRETSIVFALLIGVIVLKERLDLARVVSVAVTLSGAVLLRIGRS